MSFLARKFVPKVAVDPNITTKTLQDEVEKKYQIQVSDQKVSRAKAMATKKIEGDYRVQYELLRDYCAELMRSNPGTTVKIDVEREFNPSSTTRQFKRIYICLGALKTGFKMIGREILGLDGCFMKGPFPGQILTAVGLDSNNGIYLVAYALVEAETKDSWIWFLECLGDDLDLYANSNFTFISDRQKGIIPALEDVFSRAEHRFCLRHIQENMKSRWRGKLFKNLLTRCAFATLIPFFEKAMKAVYNEDESLHDWLKQIPPKHWRRAMSDVLLNNVCESIAKCDGPLTPNITNIFEAIKTEASQYKVIWNGRNKYQDSGPSLNQCVVDIDQKNYSCRKWELTGIPCKHAVAVNWNMVKNNIDVGSPESWVSEVYLLETWKKVYENTIDPINGWEMWTPFECPTTLVPPKHNKQIGRPKKQRKISEEEMQLVNKGKMTRIANTVQAKRS
ncbi:uncharacterized protein LOC143635351 [Bidens hawaiensis]|uniref:uncharacterized protein LOC143635351 n=1 Tax=Bidens hawaiensis TaxID=980011 RepID=UPI00404AE582